MTGEFINAELCQNLSTLSPANFDAHVNNESISNLQSVPNTEQSFKDDSNMSLMQIQVNLQDNNNLPSVDDKRLSNVYITLPLEPAVKYSMNYVCRLCATVIDSNSAIHIFPTDQFHHDLSCKINKYLPIIVYEDDPFPKTVCNPCVTKLNQFHDLVVKCISVEEQLRQTYVFDERYLDEMNKKINPKSDEEVIKQDSENNDNLFSVTEFQFMENLDVHQLNSPSTVKEDGRPGRTGGEETVPEKVAVQSGIGGDPFAAGNPESENCLPDKRNEPIEGIQPICRCCDSPLKDLDSCFEHLNQHYTGGAREKETPCLMCSDVYSSRRDLEEHFKTHLKPSLTSPKVNATCNSRDKAKARQQKVLKGKLKICSKLLTCRKCKQALDGIDVAVEHCLKHKPSNVKCYPCVICVNGIGKAKLREHISMHFPTISKPILTCDNCNNLYPDEKTLKYHRCTKLRKFKCTQCKQGFKSEDRLKFHEDFHKHKSTFCDICKKDFKFESRIYLHFAGVHNGIRDKPYCCDVCGKTFTWLTLLNSHKRTHTNERPFKCTKCDARFCSKYSLNGHMPSHDDHPQMYCDKCDYHTGRKQNLQNHVSRFHKEISSAQTCVRCRTCNEIFPNVRDADVEDHSSRHSQEEIAAAAAAAVGSESELPEGPFQEVTISKLYQCERCERCFASVDHLTQHRTAHPGEDSNSFYQCRLCDISFAKHDLLVKHRKIHVRVTSQYTGKLTVLIVISCDICGMECVDYRQLLNHKDRANCMMKKITGTLRPRKVLIKKHLQPLKTHQLFVNSSGLFECPSCQRTYKNRRRYRLHLATHPNADIFK